MCWRCCCRPATKTASRFRMSTSPTSCSRLLGSGHETTASSLAWALERLSRHPELLSRLAEEADAGGSELRQATIWEVQRTRPVLDGTTRRTKTRIRLGDWVLPEGTNIIISIKLAHDSEDELPGRGVVQPGPVHGHRREARRLDPVRRRRQPLCRRGVRQHGVGHRPAHAAARIPFRANRCAGRTGDGGAVWRPCRQRARERWFTGEPTKPSQRCRLAVRGGPRQRVTPGILAAVTSALRQYVKPIGSYSWFKKAMNKYWYPFVTRRWDQDDVVFLNWGYEEDPPMGLPLAPEDEPNRYCIQLYHRTATQTDLSGKKVLEPSCGHGGGALLRRCTRLLHRRLTSTRTASHSPKRHNLPGLDFVHGDAESLPFPMSPSTRCSMSRLRTYPHFDRFLPRWYGCCARAGISSTSISAGSSNTTTGTRHWPACRGMGPSARSADVLRGLDNNSAGPLDLVAPCQVLQSFAQSVRRRTRDADVQGTAARRLSYRMYHFIKD